MSEQRRNEKDEKNEKKDEKHEKDEKWRGEKWRNDPVGGVVWALILIWAGVVFLTDGLGTMLPGFGTWPLIFTGAGALILLGALARLLMPEHRTGVTGGLVMGAVFLCLGLAMSNQLNWIRWENFWALIIIALGISILLGVLFRRKK